MKVALDTTVLIDMLNEEKSAIMKIEEVRTSAALYTTSINIYEIRKGIGRIKKNREKYEEGLEAVLDNLYVLPFNPESAEKAAGIYASLANKGVFIDEADYLIGGCCLSNGIHAIITRNHKHFRSIRGFEQVITY
jgi:predicted nucleic acid-binding protein